MNSWREGFIYGIVGASVGLLLWFATSWILDDATRWGSSETVYWPGIVAGLMPFGALLGLVVALTPGVRGSSLASAVGAEFPIALLGLVLGALAGGLGGWIGEWCFAALKLEMPGVGRVVGTSVFGLALGLASGVTELVRSKSRERMVSAILGGLAGGLIAGLAFHGLGLVTRSPNVLALSFGLLGAVIAGGIGLITAGRTSAYLCGLDENREFSRKYLEGWSVPLLGDAPNLIGSALPGRRSPRSTLKLVDDELVGGEHAFIERAEGSWFVEPAGSGAGAPIVYVDGEEIRGPVELRPGSVLQFGQLLFSFEIAKQEERAPSRRPAYVRSLAWMSLLLAGLFLASGEARALGSSPAGDPAARIVVTNVELNSPEPGVAEMWIAKERNGQRVEFDAAEIGDEKIRVTWGDEEVGVVEVQGRGERRTPPELHFLIVVDTSGSMAFPVDSPRIERVGQALEGLFSGLESDPNVFLRVLAFDDRVPAVDNLLTDSQPVLDTLSFAPSTAENARAFSEWVQLFEDYVIRQRETRNFHDTALYQAIRYGIDEVRRAGPGQKRLLVLTDGENDLPRSNPFAMVEGSAVIREAELSGIPVYTVGYELEDLGARDYLDRVASATGGVAEVEARSEQLRSMMKRVVEHAFKEVRVVTRMPAFTTGTLRPVVEWDGSETALSLADAQELHYNPSWLLGARVDVLSAAERARLQQGRLLALLVGVMLLGACAFVAYGVRGRSAMPSSGSRVAQVSSRELMSGEHGRFLYQPKRAVSSTRGATKVRTRAERGAS